VIFHGAGLQYSYHWKLTYVTVGEAAGYGSLVFRNIALAGPNGVAPGGPGNLPTAVPAPGAAPTSPLPIGTVVDPATGLPPTSGSSGAGGANRAPANLLTRDQVVKYATTTTFFGITNRVSAAVNVFGQAAYSVSGSIGAEKSALYPTVGGPTLSAGLSYRLSGTDALSSTGTLQYLVSSNGPSPWLLSLSEGWVHRLSARTVALLGVGVSGTRKPDPSGLTEYSIYPTFNAGIAHSRRLEGGVLSAGMNVVSTPVLDLVTGVVDPRITLGANVGWARSKFSTNAGAFSVISTAGANSAGSFSSFGGSIGVGYQLTPAVSVDGGLRAAYQQYQGVATVPLSYAFFLGLSFGVPVYTNHR